MNIILQSLRASNYLKGTCVAHGAKINCESNLLKNGLKLREQLLKEWLIMSTTWSTEYGGAQQIVKNLVETDKRTLFLQESEQGVLIRLGSEFQKSYNDIYKEKLVNLVNSIALKTICNNVGNNLISENSIFYGSKTKTLLVTDFYVAAENELTKYNNLQRERKIWWMRFSSNPSRYRIEPHDLSKKACDDILKESKSTTITANFPYGLVDMECISLVSLYKLDALNIPFYKHPYKISLIRSIINLDLAASALILDGSVRKTENANYALMLNRKLAPYQVLLANLHQGNKIVDELTLHLQYIINKSGLRLYDNFIRTNIQTELEEKFMHFDTLGIPFILLVDNESIKSGLIKLRSRDTSLIETIHISDIPNYLLNLFKQ